MANSGVSLNNVSSVPTVGAVIHFDQPVSRVGIAITVTGSPSSLNVKTEVSVDGSNYFILDQEQGVNGGLFNVLGAPINYARSSLTALAGGSGPAVTVWLSGE